MSLAARQEWLPVRIAFFLLGFFAVTLPVVRPANAFLLVVIASGGLSWYFRARKLSASEVFVLLVYFLLIFDSPAFSFTSLNIKAWYPIIALMIVYGLLKDLTRGVLPVRLKTLAPLAFFLLLSLYYLFADSQTGRIYNIKYWLFTIGLWLVLISKSVPLFRARRELFTSYLLGLFLFVGCFGLLQFAAVTAGVGSFYMLYPQLIRPDAFFSETTWYATYCLFGLLFLFWYVRTHLAYKLLAAAPILVVGLLLSNTRNALLPLLAVIVLGFVFWLAKNNLAVRRKYLTAALLTAAGAALLALAMLPLVTKLVGLVLLKLRLEDASAVGRTAAFGTSLDLIMRSPVFGQGFYWDDTFVILRSGTAIGAKSFDLFLQVFYIFGLVGLVPFVILVGSYLLRAFARSFTVDSVDVRYGLYFFLSFIVMSIFAPLHQFPMGIQMLALSNVLLWKDRGRRESQLRHAAAQDGGR